MTPEKRAQLRMAIDAALQGGFDRIAEMHGASETFNCGAHVVRCMGVTGTATMGRQAALESWLRAARKKVAEGKDDPINLQGSGPAAIEAREELRVERMFSDDAVAVADKVIKALGVLQSQDGMSVLVSIMAATLNQIATDDADRQMLAEAIRVDLFDVMKKGAEGRLVSTFDHRTIGGVT